MQSTVSVIIVNYNTGKLLTKAVKSVLRLPGVEVVVADNASRDTSFTDLKKAISPDNLILIDNGANLGFGQAVNQAVKQSHGQYVYLLNPDAALTTTALARMLETAKKYGDRAIIAPRLENPDGTPQASCYRQQTIINAIKEYWLGQSGAYAKYLPSGTSPQQVHAAVAAAWLVPRSVWDELGGLSSRFFLYFEDLEMCDRAGRAGIPVVYDPRAIVKHAHGVSSRTNPIVMKLFTDSAWTYHGWLKKLTLDAIIRLRDLCTPPISTKKVLISLLLYWALVLVVTTAGYWLLAERYTPPPTIPESYRSNFLLWSWANFDGEHYLNIAKNGYQTLKGQSEHAFFPLFPLLINLVSRTGLDLYLAAHLINTASLIGFIFILLAWARKYFTNPLPLMWLMLLSPGAIFLSAIYSEPLFLLLTVTTFYYGDRGSWGKAALVAGLATATRVNGIFLVLFLLIKLVQGKESFSSLIRHTVLALSGLALYMYYLYRETGNALAWYSAQEGWDKATATLPWVTLSHYLRALTLDFQPDLTHAVVAIEVIVTGLMIYLLIRFWRTSRLSRAYAYYALGNLVLPLATGSLGSMPRFSLALFPLFSVIPSLPRPWRAAVSLIFVSCALISILFFTRGVWYA